MACGKRAKPSRRKHAERLSSTTSRTSQVEWRVIAPPEELLKLLKKGVTLRNSVAHVGEQTLDRETVEQILFAVRDVLWLLDYYRGFEWAYDHIRDETKSLLPNRESS